MRSPELGRTGCSIKTSVENALSNTLSRSLIYPNCNFPSLFSIFSVIGSLCTVPHTCKKYRRHSLLFTRFDDSKLASVLLILTWSTVSSAFQGHPVLFYQLFNHCCQSISFPIWFLQFLLNMANYFKLFHVLLLFHSNSLYVPYGFSPMVFRESGSERLGYS